jgi:hypothetical protein
MAPHARLYGFWIICILFVGISFCTPVKAEVPKYDPSKFDKIFGKPEDFVKKLEADMAPKLNEYMGLGVACSGFVLVIRSLVK